MCIPNLQPWQAGTGPFQHVMQEDRIAVIYGASGPIWATGTDRHVLRLPAWSRRMTAVLLSMMVMGELSGADHKAQQVVRTCTVVYQGISQGVNGMAVRTLAVCSIAQLCCDVQVGLVAMFASSQAR